MKYSILLLIFLMSLSKAYSINDKLSISTGELAPYSYIKNNVLTGIAIDIVKELQKRTNYKHEILQKPWARVIRESESKNMMTFPIARLPYREKLYKWIGPILTDKTIFAVKKSNFKEISSIEELKNYSIGVNRGAPTAKRLHSLHFKNLNIVSSETQLSKMFIKERFKLWYSTKYMIYDILNKEGFNMRELKIMYTDLTLHMYIATSLDIDNKIIEKWQKELNKMKEDGRYQKILDSYNIMK